MMGFVLKNVEEGTNASFCFLYSKWPSIWYIIIIVSMHKLKVITVEICTPNLSIFLKLRNANSLMYFFFWRTKIDRTQKNIEHERDT